MLLILTTVISFFISVITTPPDPDLSSNNSQKLEKKVSLTPQESSVDTSKVNTNQKIKAQVTRVIDGDTIEASFEGKIKTVRLIGINTPETVDPRTTVECFGTEASNKAKELLNNKMVYLEADPIQGEFDKYQRLLRYVWLDENTNFNKKMIYDGYAYEYTYSTAYKYQADFKQAETNARTNSRGLWSPNTCSGEKSINIIKIDPTATPTSTQNTNSIIRNTSGTCQYSCSSPDKDCSDFTSRSEAQNFFNCCGFTATNDPMKLDSVGVGDGVVCESLP